MLSVKNLSGEEELLVSFNGFRRNRKINGEKTIELTVLPDDESFNLIEEESTIFHDADKYIVKKLNERSTGNKTIKRINGVHKFYVDLINKQQPNVHNGSITFTNYMNMVFEGTGYTFTVTGSFPAREFQNLGNESRLALLSKGLERFKAEMELVGNEVRFREQIGNNTDFQFRYGHNIKTIDKTVDTTNLTTIIRGKWEDGMELEYRSPNADIFGEIEAPLFDDERFTTEETRLEAMKESLEDTPEFSITIDFADLRAAGYPYTVPNEGDRVFVIYEPMNDLLLETRILEIDETLDADLKPIKTNVTLANHKKTFAGTMFDNVEKQIGKIVNEDGVVKDSVLSEAVRVATEALHSAQTELEFNNGILAIDPNDPNRVVLFNSAGIGISDDGGQTFETAMTGEGIVADTITVGTLRGLILMGNEIYGGLIEGATLRSTSDQYGTTTIRNGTLTQEGQSRGTSLNRGILDVFNNTGERNTNVSPANVQLRHGSGSGSALNIEIIPSGPNAGQRQITGVDYLEVGRLRVLDEIIEP